MPDPTSSQPLRIGISTKHFHLSGAADLLRTIIRGLAVRREHQFFLLMEHCEQGNPRDEQDEPCDARRSVWRRIGRVLPVPAALRRVTRKMERVTKRLVPRHARQRIRSQSELERRAESVYGEVVRPLTVVPCDGTPEGLERAAAEHRLDVVLPTLSPLSVPFVSYLYDCQHKYHPENFGPREPELRDRAFRSLLESSQALIVNSQNAKHDLRKFFDADPQVVFALPFTPLLGHDALKPRPELLQKYDLPPRYFMVSNQFWVHKSLETALSALRIVLDEGLGDCRLVFTGRMQDSRFPGYIHQFMQFMRQLQLHDKTHFLGYIPKRDQLEIMKHAVAVIQPTLFEGGPGGGAVYDAVAHGVRCLVSDIPINHELPVGENLVLFEKQNQRDLANKMREAWEQRDYVRPADKTLLAADGARLEKFSDELYRAVAQAISRDATHPRISVITVCKNAVASLKGTIDSVLSQDYAGDIEYVVIDGGSTDGTLEILKSYGDRIQWVSGPDGGIYDAMNKGIARATGDVLYFLNSGDTVFDPQAFTAVMAAMADPAVGFVYGNVQFVEEDGHFGRYLPYENFLPWYYRDNCQCHQVCFYRREMFSRYGTYDTSFKIYGDQEFNARLVVKHNVVSRWLDRPVVYYREGGFSAQTVASGLNAAEKKRIEAMYQEQFQALLPPHARCA